MRNKYLDTFAHTLLSALHCRAPREARRRAVLHRRQQPDVPDHARRRHPDGHQRRRAGLRPREVAARSPRPTCASPSATRRAGPTPRSPTRTRSPRSSSSATASGSASCPTASRTPATTAPRRSTRLGLEPRQATSCSSAAWSPRTTRTCSSRRSRASPAERARGMKLVVVGGAPYADEYIKQVQRARRPARDLPGLRLRPRLLGAAAPRLRLLRADRGRRHAPGHPRGARRRQLRARQRPRPERRDGRRRRPDVLGQGGRAVADRASSSASSTSPSSSSTTARGRASARGATRGTRSPTSTSSCSSASRTMGGPGALPRRARRRDRDLAEALGCRAAAEA